MRVRWVGNVTLMDGVRNAYKMLVGIPNGMNHVAVLDVD
jgi:hypothetical protein